MTKPTRWLSLSLMAMAFVLIAAACGSDPTATPTAAKAAPDPTATPTAAPPTATPTALPPGVTAPPPPKATATPIPPTATPTPAFDAEAYFGGKTIKIITGTSPGGGYDTFSRFFARFAEKYFPESTRFVVQNLPGAAQLRGLLAVMRAEPDGLTMGPTHQRWVQREVLVGDVPDFDLENAYLLGTPSFSLENESGFCIDRSIGTSWADVLARGKPITNGETGPGNAPAQEFIAAIGGPIKNVYGYGGTSEIMAAFDRHEIDSTGRCSPSTQALYPEWPAENRLVPLWYSEKPYNSEWLEAIGVGADYEYPQLIDFLKSPEFGIPITQLQIDAIQAHIQVSQLGRMFFLPAGVPEDVRNYWDEAFRLTVLDAGFKEAAVIADYGDSYGYQSGADMQQYITTLQNMDQEIKDIVLEISAIDQLSF